MPSQELACQSSGSEQGCQEWSPVGGAVCTALTAICKLISQDLINAVLPGVTALLSHPKELVRKKAVMALHRFQQLDPDHEGALSGMDFDRHFRQALCDKVPPRPLFPLLASSAGHHGQHLQSWPCFPLLKSHGALLAWLCVYPCHCCSAQSPQ